ncbi:LysR substrate-binding domain-containing protein [Roseomonas sp. GC11]|uniref:LysR family transcriptional regulator n=1 Tax=Roseomonas sp. GC11 TaxID=2950546 RepID=UPI00210B09F0|nr:LysR substrate-binding domain-containing protein [Roseomonas sp. GC11]MCQ4160336.1 LysR substrate-binding domain-containing protein [Roseomonas sp. GC11]
MLTLRQIEVFRAVLRAGTLVGAARELGIAQPTASRILARVEDVMGLPLFERAGGRLHPTAEARRMLEEIDRAYEALRAAVGRAAEAARLGESRFHVGASPSLGRMLVPAALAGLTQRHPELSLHLDVLSVSQVATYLTEGPGEVAVTLFPIAQAGLRSARVGRGAPVALVPRDWPLARREVLRPEDLRGLPLAVFEGWSVHGQVLNAFLAQAGVVPGRRHHVRFADSAAALAEAGLAVAVIDPFSALSARRDRLAVLPTSGERGFEVYVHRVVDRVQGRFLKTFEALLAEGIAALPQAMAMP